MSSGGFWPGESPPAAEQEDAQNGEAPVAEPLGWPQPREQEPQEEESKPEAEPDAEATVEPEPEPESEPESEPEPEPEPEAEEEEPEVAPAGHIPGELDIPDGVAVLEGSPSGADRTVGVVVSRFNGEVSNKLLESALDALAAAGVSEERITVMPVPGAFELPFGAMALAKTRRYSCIVALGC